MLPLRTEEYLQGKCPTYIIAVHCFATSRTRKEALGFLAVPFFVLDSFGEVDRIP